MDVDDIEWVDSVDRLQELVSAWRSLPCIGLDTEFVRTDTYFAKPGLIQVNAGGDIVLLDPIALPDLSAFATLLEDAGTVKILHSGAEDVALIERLTGTRPHPMFDCQIAAAHCGLGNSASYRALVQEIEGVELEKSQTRSNWCKRPLSKAQCHYAAEDVRYLPQLYRHLHERLVANDRLPWAEEDFATLGQEPSAPSYARIRGAGRLSPRRLHLLGELDRWREDEAVARDRPRGHIVPDRALLEMAAQSPTNRETLANLDDVSPRFVRRYADQVLEIIREQGKSAPAALPLPLKVPSSHRDHVEALRTFVAKQAEILGIAPELIASRRQLETLIIGLANGVRRPELRVSSGWRFRIIEPELIALLGAPALAPHPNGAEGAAPP